MASVKNMASVKIGTAEEAADGSQRLCSARPAHKMSVGCNKNIPQSCVGTRKYCIDYGQVLLFELVLSVP
eukprot:SAG11_NODE_792_length_7143_cov_38.103492_3_plen_70_part_00